MDAGPPFDQYLDAREGFLCIDMHFLHLVLASSSQGTILVVCLVFLSVQSSTVGLFEELAVLLLYPTTAPPFYLQFTPPFCA